jgi:hypothetical protein
MLIAITLVILCLAMMLIRVIVDIQFVNQVSKKNKEKSVTKVNKDSESNGEMKHIA